VFHLFIEIFIFTCYIVVIVCITAVRERDLTASMRGGTTMTKTDLVTRIAKDAALTKRQADKALQAMLASVQDAMSHGEKVKLAGFGTFAVRARRSERPQSAHGPCDVDSGAQDPYLQCRETAASGRQLGGVRGVAQSRSHPTSLPRKRGARALRGRGPL
jgi:DNA-binding protein HU-beta